MGATLDGLKMNELADYISSPVFLEASGTTEEVAAAPTTLNFTLDTWAFPLLIHSVKVVAVTGSADFDFEIHEAAPRTDMNLSYRYLNANDIIMDKMSGGPIIFRPAKQNGDADYGDEIADPTVIPFFCTIVNRGTASQFYVEIRYKVQGGPLANTVAGAIPEEEPITEGV